MRGSSGELGAERGEKWELLSKGAAGVLCCCEVSFDFVPFAFPPFCSFYRSIAGAPLPAGWPHPAVHGVLVEAVRLCDAVSQERMALAVQQGACTYGVTGACGAPGAAPLLCITCTTARNTIL